MSNVSTAYAIFNCELTYLHCYLLEQVAFVNFILFLVFLFLMPSIYTVVMDDGDGANELESFPTHKEALDYLKQQVHDWNNTDKWDMTKKRLAMVIAENGLELELIEETPSSDFEYHETWNSVFGWSGDSQ